MTANVASVSQSSAAPRSAVLLAATVLAGCSVTAGVSRSMTGSAGASSSGAGASEVASRGGESAPTGGAAEPDLRGMTFGAALRAARAAGFAGVYQTSLLQCSGPRPDRDRVWCQFPPADTLDREIRVVMNGPDRHNTLTDEDVRGLVGLTVDAARQRLEDLGYEGKLTIGKLDAYSAKCAQGRVCRTFPDRAIHRVDEKLELQLNRSAEAVTPPP